MSIEDLVNNPKHYNSHWSGIEAIEFTEQLIGNLSNAFKYVYRHESKWNPIQDIEKALWYLKRELKRLGAKPATKALDLSWQEDISIYTDKFIFRVIDNPASNMSKALFYIWVAGANSISSNAIVAPISKALYYTNLILEEKRKQLLDKGKSNG